MTTDTTGATRSTAATAARVERLSTTITYALATTSDACVAWGAHPRETRLRFEIAPDAARVVPSDAWVARVRLEHAQGSTSIVTMSFADPCDAVALIDAVCRAFADWSAGAKLWRSVTTLVDAQGRTEYHEGRVWARDADEADQLAPVAMARQIEPVSETTSIHALPRSALAKPEGAR